MNSSPFSIVFIYEKDNAQLALDLKAELEKSVGEIQAYCDLTTPFIQFAANIIAPADAVILVNNSLERRHFVDDKEKFLHQIYDLAWKVENKTEGVLRSKFLHVALTTDIAHLPDYASRFVVNAQGASLDKVSSEILSYISALQIIKGNSTKIVQENININLDSYIIEATKSIRKRENFLNIMGNSLNGLGLLVVGAGLVYSVADYRTNGGIPITSLISSASSNSTIVYALAYHTLRSIAIFGVVFATCRYCFQLGKTYIDEGIQVSNRIHAIEFGRFYLRVFGNQIEKSEVREIFQNWNFESQSSFSSLDTSAFDPKTTEGVVEIVKALTAIKGGS